MIRLIAVIPVLLLMACSTAPRRPAEPVYMETAEVTRVEPLYRKVQVARPVNQCWTERVAYPTPPRSNVGATLTGGLIGGLIGSKLGRRRHNAPLVMAGVLAGAEIGQRLSQPPYVPTSTWSNVQRCTRVNRYEERNQVVGYRVDYRYEGQTFTTQTRHHPGRYIRLRVDVEPVDGG